MKKIFIVDDYEESCRTLSEILSVDYETKYTSDSKIAFEMAKAFKPDLVLVDYQMPDVMGLDLCKMIRQDPETKNTIIFFISGAASQEEKIKAFEHGANDFVSKPYHVKELILRVKARLSDRDTGVATMLTTGNLKINLISREVFVNDVSVDLTVKQFEILKMLMETPGKLVTRERFLNEIWDGVEVNSRNVDSQINYLKKKIQGFEGTIYSIAGQGYVLESTPTPNKNTLVRN